MQEIMFMKKPTVVDSPSGRVAKQTSELDLLGTEACGGRKNHRKLVPRFRKIWIFIGGRMELRSS